MSKKEKGSLWDHHQQVKCKGRHLSEIEKKKFMEAIDITLVEKLRAKNAKRIHQVEA